MGDSFVQEAGGMCLTRPPAKSSPTQTWFSKIKDAVLFAGGIVGMVFEAGFVTEPRTILIGAYLLAMGLPVFNGVDRLFQRSPAAPPEDGETPT